jgi:hypothetical protein
VHTGITGVPVMTQLPVSDFVYEDGAIPKDEFIKVVTEKAAAITDVSKYC